MNNPRLTQCPHCKASFKVSDDQINAAQGRVRCGSCMNIFDAIAYSIAKVPSPEPKTTTEYPPQSDALDEEPSSDSAPVELEDSILEKDDGFLFADDPEQDQQDSNYFASQDNPTEPLSSEFSTSFLELDKSPKKPKSPFTTNFTNLDDNEYSDMKSKDAIDESWANEILNDEHESKIEPHFEDEELSTYNADDKEINKPEPQFDSSHPPLNDEAQLKNKQLEGTVLTDSSENAKFQYQQDPDSKIGKWFRTGFFWLLNTSLIIMLIAQAAWFNYEKLVKYPVFASIYQFTCEQLDCTLPTLSDIGKIKNQNLVVRSLPTKQKALIIDTIIVNDADFDQDFPDIALFFSNINKEIIAQRLIKPSEYLSGDLLNWENMPTGQPIHISLEIIDPGKEAVNYRLAFFSHKPVH